MTEYLKPATIDEALRLGSRDGTAYMGGGTWLNSRQTAGVDALISLEALNLDGIHRDDGVIRVGSCARFQDLLDFGGLPTALADAVHRTASRMLRNMVTLGGDLALHEPTSCVVPALLALGATVVHAGVEGESRVDGYLKSKIDGLIAEVRIPDNGMASNLRSLSRTSHSRITFVCAVAAGCTNGVLEDLRIVAGDCVTDAIRLTAVETALEGKTVPPKPAIEELVMSHFTPHGDFHAGAAYKRYTAGVTIADIIHGFFDREARS